MLRHLFRVDQPVDRRTYLVAGLSLAVIKSLGDFGLAKLANVHPWAPWGYVRIGPDLLNANASAPRWLFVALGCWALPFLWFGATLTIRRLIDAGRSPWWSALFLIPLANYALILALIFLPSAEPTPLTRAPRNRPTMATAMASIGVGTGVGLAMVLLSITVLGAYGTPLFLGTPLAMGVVTAGALFLLAIDGAVCLLMAVPIALWIGLMGAYIGRTIARTGQDDVGPAAAALLVLPLALLLDSHASPPPLHEVRSSIDAPIPSPRTSMAPASARRDTASSRPARSSSPSRDGSLGSVCRSMSRTRRCR